MVLTYWEIFRAFVQDALEINFSCPHGMPERKMGAAMGQDCVLLDEVCGWINAKASVPVWAKMTPNITDITHVGTQTFYIVLIMFLGVPAIRN
jgi:dihydroorotate dehydrogenase